MQWVVSGAVVAATMMVSACQRPAEDPRVAFQQSATVNITANCTAGNQVDVVVDPWVLRMKKKGDVSFNTITTSGAVIELTEKSADKWPFDQSPPFKGSSKGNKIKDKKGDYRYNVRIACAVGTTGDSVRVVIDPDIFVD